ncbi:MAG TPA: hypothetical protein VF384_11860 [Planctomycetota bacterium]
MPHDGLTFALAFAAFALLALDATLRWRRRRFGWLTWTVLAVATSHIGCVWAFRFDWDAGAMWAKSAFAFVLFHGAAACLAVSAASREPVRTRGVWCAFAIVCAGAVPAPFRYPEIAWLRTPVIAVAAASVVAATLPRRAADRERQSRGDAAAG